MKAYPVILSCLLTIAFQEKITGCAIYIYIIYKMIVNPNTLQIVYYCMRKDK